MTDIAVDELLSVCACDLGVELLTLTGTYFIRKASIHSLFEHAEEVDGKHLIDLDVGTRSLRLLVNEAVIKYDDLTAIFGLRDWDSVEACIGNADEMYLEMRARYKQKQESSLNADTRAAESRSAS